MEIKIRTSSMYKELREKIWKLQIWVQYDFCLDLCTCTLGPAYNEFGLHVHWVLLTMSLVHMYTGSRLQRVWFTCTLGPAYNEFGLHVHWVPLTTSLVYMYTGSRLQRVWFTCTLGPAYNEFGYNKHSLHKEYNTSHWNHWHQRWKVWLQQTPSRKVQFSLHLFSRSKQEPVKKNN